MLISLRHVTLPRYRYLIPSKHQKIWKLLQSDHFCIWLFLICDLEETRLFRCFLPANLAWHRPTAAAAKTHPVCGLVKAGSSVVTLNGTDTFLSHDGYQMKYSVSISITLSVLVSICPPQHVTVGRCLAAVFRWLCRCAASKLNMLEPLLLIHFLISCWHLKAIQGYI